VVACVVGDSLAGGGEHFAGVRAVRADWVWTFSVHTVQSPTGSSSGFGPLLSSRIPTTRAISSSVAARADIETVTAHRGLLIPSLVLFLFASRL